VSAYASEKIQIVSSWRSVRAGNHLKQLSCDEGIKKKRVYAGWKLTDPIFKYRNIIFENNELPIDKDFRMISKKI